MAYTFNQIALGQKAIDLFVAEYNILHSDKIQSADVLAAAKKYDDRIFLGILGNHIELAMESDLELLDESMKSLAANSSGGLPTADSFLNYVKSNKISDITLVLWRPLKEAGAQVVAGFQYGFWVFLVLGIVAIIFIGYSHTKRIAGV